LWDEVLETVREVFPAIAAVTPSLSTLMLPQFVSVGECQVPHGNHNPREFILRHIRLQFRRRQPQKADLAFQALFFFVFLAGLHAGDLLQLLGIETAPLLQIVL